MDFRGGVPEFCIQLQLFRKKNWRQFRNSFETTLKKVPAFKTHGVSSKNGVPDDTGHTQDVSLSRSEAGEPHAVQGARCQRRRCPLRLEDRPRVPHQGVSGGKDKLQALIDKAKKSIVAHKKKMGSPKKKTPTKSCPKRGSDAGEDFDEFIECLTTHLKDKLVGHRSLVDQMLKVFDEDISPQQLNALSDTKAIKELALVMTHVEESDDEDSD